MHMNNYFNLLFTRFFLYLILLASSFVYGDYSFFLLPFNICCFQLCFHLFSAVMLMLLSLLLKLLLLLIFRSILLRLAYGGNTESSLLLIFPCCFAFSLSSFTSFPLSHYTFIFTTTHKHILNYYFMSKQFYG